jgi:hypothetical protein
MESYCPKVLYHKNNKNAITDERSFKFLLKKYLGEIIDINYDFYKIGVITLKPYVPFVRKEKYLEINTPALVNKREIIIFANYTIKIVIDEKIFCDIYTFKNLKIKLTPEPIFKEFKNNYYNEIKISNENNLHLAGPFEEFNVENYSIQIFENNKLLMITSPKK